MNLKSIPPDWISPRGVCWWKDIMFSKLAGDLKLADTSVWIVSEFGGRHWSRCIIQDSKILFSSPEPDEIRTYLQGMKP